MSLTKLSGTLITDNAITTEKLSSNAVANFANTSQIAEISARLESAFVTANIANTNASGVVPKISSISIANSSYVILDDTAANTGGGYIVVSGSGFQSGAQVIVENTPATSVTFINSTTIRAQVPAKSAASYNIFVVNPDGGTGIAVNGLTYSATPTWVTGSTITAQQVDVAFNLNFDATGATTYAVANGSSLPSGTTLSSNGYFYGTVTGISTATTYNFSINAIDAENQESTRSFSLTVNTEQLWLRRISTTSYDNFAKDITTDPSGNIYIAIDSKAYGAGQGSTNNSVIIKYNNQGTKQWEKYINLDGEESITRIKTDNSDYVYSCGFQGSSPISLIRSTHSSNGNTQWSRTVYQNVNGNQPVFRASAIAPVGEVVVFATHGSEWSNLSNFTQVLSSVYKANGQTSATYDIYRSTGNEGKGIIYDLIAANNSLKFILSVGNRNGDSSNYGAEWGNVKVSEVYSDASYFARQQSVQEYGSSASDTYQRITIDSANNSYVTGNTTESVGTSHFTMTKILNNGNRSWYRSYRSGSEGTGICIDGEGYIYAQFNENANNCVVYVKYDSNGTLQWQRRFIKSGITLKGAGLSAKDNLIVGLMQADTSPKSVILLKLLKDGSGTATYTDSYIYENSNYTFASPSNISSSPTTASITYSPSGSTFASTGGNDSHPNTSFTITDLTV